ncbi:MAG: type II toxin-antitoxin system VapC family toxin [Planctomycetia bacterium]
MLLLDTHALVWLASDQTHLTDLGKTLVQRASGRLFLSAISSLEIALLVKRNRLELPLPPQQFVADSIRQHGITEIPVDSTIAMAAAALPDIHSDPFDRILAATALLHGLQLLSKDSVLRQYPGVTVAW